MWLNANKYGLSSLRKNNGYLRGSICRPLSKDSDRHWGIGYGIDLVAPLNYTSKFVVQQAYGEMRWHHGVLTIGSKEYPMELKNNSLSSGSQTLGINARPIPQVRIALPEYWTLPIGGRWLHMKGHIAYGWQTDERWQHDFTSCNHKYADDVKFHSKAGYLKIGNKEKIKHWSLELGLEMATLYGGTAYGEPDASGNVRIWQGETGLKGMWHSFIPGGGDQGEGLYENMAGDDLGSWVARLNYDTDKWAAHLYIDHFFEILNTKIEECKDGLIERFSLIASQSPYSATFMYNNRTMLGYIPEEGIISALKHGTLAIGQIGIAETLQILIGKDQTTPEGMELAKKIEQLFNDRCKEYKAATYTIKNFYTDDILAENIHLNIGVYLTPAESLCHTALKKFRDKYGVIPNVSDKEFFTNSIHIPVWCDVTPFEKIDLESQLTKYSNAGCITYVEIDSAASQNIEAIEKIVVYAMENDVPYLGLNLSLDTCRDCGWSGEINDMCPACKSTNIQRLRRVTGYITEDFLTAFNAGKVDEVYHRVKHHGIVKNI